MLAARLSVSTAPSASAAAADLHVHTTASDGSLSPAECAAHAHLAGLQVLAITDHDTMDGVAGARAAAPADLLVIPGIEFGCRWPGSSSEIHILGYGCDPEQTEFAGELRALREARTERASAIVRRLNQLGLPITLADVHRHAGQGTIGRPHIARALVERGCVADAAEAFARYLNPGAPAYVDHYRPTPGRAIALIRAAGGVPVLAHPGTIADDAVVRAVLDLGLAGVEVYHPAHGADDVCRYLDMARRRGLLVTGGSDFHGPGSEGAPIGSHGVSRAEVNALLRLLGLA